MTIVPRYVPQSGNMKMVENGTYVAASDYDELARKYDYLLNVLPHFLSAVETGQQSAPEALATVKTAIELAA